jgi:hypothetical protein
MKKYLIFLITIYAGSIIAIHSCITKPLSGTKKFQPDTAIEVTLLRIDWKDQPLSKIIVADSTGRTYEYIMKNQYGRARYFIGHKYLLVLDKTRCNCEPGSYIQAQLKYYRRK